MKQYSDRKIVASGSVIESYHYLDQTYIFGEARPKKYKEPEQEKEEPRVLTPEEQEENRARSIYRSRTTLQRLVNANVWRWFKPNGKAFLPIFITLTFAEDVRDITAANGIFSKFIKRLNYEMGAKESFLKYVVVPEFQDKTRNGVVHYHAVFFNLNHIWKDRLSEVWGQGFVDIKRVRSNDIGRYMSKYISKKFDDARLHGHKRYFPSNGLIKPEVIREQKVAKIIVASIPGKYIKVDKEYESAYFGRVHYTRFQLGKRESVGDALCGFL